MWNKIIVLIKTVDSTSKSPFLLISIKMVRWYGQALWLLRLLNQEAGSTFILLYVDDDVLINPWYHPALTIIINMSPWSSCFPWMNPSYVKVRWIWGDSNFWLVGGQYQLCWWYQSLFIQPCFPPQAPFWFDPKLPLCSPLPPPPCLGKHLSFTQGE